MIKNLSIIIDHFKPQILYSFLDLFDVFFASCILTPFIPYPFACALYPCTPPLK